MSDYGDPGNERLGNGRTMTELMRGGPRGIRGVIVGPATPGGGPANFNPHDRSQITINIEPDGPNSAALSMDSMRQDVVAEAVKVATEAFPGGDINSIRERTAMAFEQIAKLSKSNAVRVPAKPAKPRPVPAATDSEAAAVAELAAESAELKKLAAPPPAELIDRTYSPMAAFGIKKQPARSEASTVGPAAASGPPQKLVYFEKEGIGTVPAFFHDVIISVSRDSADSPEEAGFLVLVYDLRYEQNVARWFPPADDPYNRPWAVQVNNDARLYLVYTTGFQYVYDNREHCVLRVERAFWQKQAD